MNLVQRAKFFEMIADGPSVMVNYEFVFQLTYFEMKFSLGKKNVSQH